MTDIEFPFAINQIDGFVTHYKKIKFLVGIVEFTNAWFNVMNYKYLFILTKTHWYLNYRGKLYQPKLIIILTCHLWGEAAGNMWIGQFDIWKGSRQAKESATKSWNVVNDI